MSLKRRDLLGLLLTPAVLAACGVKGKILEPEGQEDAYVYPRRYPNPASVTPPATGTTVTAPGLEEDSFGSERRTTTVIQSK